MSIFSSVSVEINKNILKSIGNNPVQFFENIVRQSGVEVHVAEDGQFVKISGDWAAVNVAYNLINHAVNQNDVNESDNVTVDTENVSSTDSIITSTPLVKTLNKRKEYANRQVKRIHAAIPTPLVIYPGWDTSDIQRAEDSGYIEPGSLSRIVCDIDKDELQTKYGIINSTSLGSSSKIAVHNTDIIKELSRKSSGNKSENYTSNMESFNELDGVNQHEGDNYEELNDIQQTQIISSENDINTSAECVDTNEMQLSENVYVHKKLSIRNRDTNVSLYNVNTETNPDSDENDKNPRSRSRRKRRRPLKFGLSDNEENSSIDEITKQRKQKRGLKTKTALPEILLDDDGAVIKRKRGRPRKTCSPSDLKCPLCSFVGKYSTQVRDHMRRRHMETSKSVQCEVCDKSFGFKKDLNRHMIRHAAPQFSCAECGKVYKDEKTLTLHYQRHEADYKPPPRHPCPQCEKSFCNDYILRNHVKSEHFGIKKLYLCPKCGKSFTQKHAYVQHANVHLGIKPYACDQCPRAFTYEKSLKEHKLLHGDVRNFMCEICKKCFRQKSALSIHKKIHRSTKDFLCSICSRGFTQKQALVRHERIHSGDKPFLCKFCGRSFSDTSIIRRHMILVHKIDSTMWQKATIIERRETNDYFVDKQVKDHPYAGILVTKENGVLSVLSNGQQLDDKDISEGDIMKEGPTSEKGVASVGNNTKPAMTVEFVEMTEHPLTVLANQAGRAKFDDLVHAAVGNTYSSGDVAEISRLMTPLETTQVVVSADGVPDITDSSQVSATDINQAIREQLQAPPHLSVSTENIPRHTLNQIFVDMQNKSIRQSPDVYVTKDLSPINSDVHYVDNGQLTISDVSNQLYVAPVQSDISVLDIDQSTGQLSHVITYPTSSYSQPQYMVLKTHDTGMVTAEIAGDDRGIYNVSVDTTADIPASITQLDIQPVEPQDGGYHYLYSNPSSSNLTPQLTPGPQRSVHTLYYQ